LILGDLRFSSGVAKIYTSHTLLGISSQVSQLSKQNCVKS